MYKISYIKIIGEPDFRTADIRLMADMGLWAKLKVFIATLHRIYY